MTIVKEMVVLLIFLLMNVVSGLQLWMPSLHDSERVEIISMLRSLNVTVVVASVTGHTGPFSNLFRGDKGVLYPSLHPSLAYTDLNGDGSLSSESFQAIFDFYRKDALFIKSDAVLCSSPLSFCESFLALNKSIVWFAAQRYSAGRCSKADWELLTARIAKTIEVDKTGRRPVSILAAMNDYDSAYINYYSGLDSWVIPSSGLLYGAAGSNYSLSRVEVLLGPSQGLFLSPQHTTELMNTAKKHGVVLSHPRGLYGRYKLHQLAHHPAAVMFPISVHSHFFAELYAMAVPLFVPDMKFLMDLGLLGDRTAGSACAQLRQHHSHLHSHGKDSSVQSSSAVVSIAPARHFLSKHVVDPESHAPGDVKYWLNLTDYYAWPHITYFSSWTDLFLKLNRTDLTLVHQAMEKENEVRHQKSRAGYERLVQRLSGQSHRSVPSAQAWQDALSAVWA